MRLTCGSVLTGKIRGVGVPRMIDIKNTIRILAKTRELISPGVFDDQRMTGARTLFNEFRALLHANGFPDDPNFGGTAVTTNGTTVFLNVENDGRISFAHRSNPDKRVFSAIEYDVATSAWVGTQPDHSVVPTPGQPIPRQPALEALAVALHDLVAAHSKKG